MVYFVEVEVREVHDIGKVSLHTEEVLVTASDEQEAIDNVVKPWICKTNKFIKYEPFVNLVKLF